MKSFQIDLPDEIATLAQQAAASQNQTLDQFVVWAVTKQVLASKRALTIEERAARADLSAFDRILARVPNVPPLPGDEK